MIGESIMSQGLSNMQINVAQLMKESTGATRTYDIEDSVWLDETTECNIQGQVELLRTKRGILVRGAFVGKTNLTCSRCLTAFAHPLVFKMEEEFLPCLDANTGASLPVDEDCAAFVIDDHHIMDLDEAFRQYSLLAIPMKPLCQPDCAGLCSQCGANLNQGDCGCPPLFQGLPPDELAKLNALRKSR